MENKKFKHVIIWGHSLHSHTHSYIHNAFFRAFQNMGYDTHWLDDAQFEENPLVRNFDYNECLFITEGQVCAKMPIIKGNTYVLHNCYDEGMWKTITDNNIAYLKLQVYTDDLLQYNLNMLEPGIYHDAEGKMLYIMWGTDLLPNEIVPFPVVARTNTSWWVGTIGDGEFGNRDQINAFINACRDNGVAFEQGANLSVEENQANIASSFMAPAIVGRWQKEKNYVPCRIFKNVSYGQFPATNSKKVNEIFGGKAIYSEYEYELFGLMVEKMKSPTYIQELTDHIKFVRENHTYINRINSILSVL